MEFVTKCAEPIGRPGNVSFPPDLAIRICGLQQGEYFGSRNACGDGIYRGEAHRAIPVDQKSRGLGNSVLFPRIVDVPLDDHSPPGVAQDGEGKIQIATHGPRFFLGVHRHGSDTGAGRADRGVVVAVVRQLAKAEGSPIAAIEQQH